MIPHKDVFQAIADPTRRQIISMLAHQSLNINAIAQEFDMTRQAISLHVRFLSDCRLISVKQKGRERYCEARLEKLNEVTTWVEDAKKVWLQQFQALDNFLAEVQKENKPTTKRKKHVKRK